jgi:hypothetical protein
MKELTGSLHAQDLTNQVSFVFIAGRWVLLSRFLLKIGDLLN